MLNNKDEKFNSEDAFLKAFGDLLKDGEKEEVAGEEPLGGIIYPSEEPDTISHEEWEKISGEFIPECIQDEQWEEFMSRTPIPPLNREQEARAVSIGLQEIRKMREYMLHSDDHMMNEFTRIFITYTLTLQKDFEETMKNARQRIIQFMEETEHLIAGDIDHVAAVKEDYRLHQLFEEKRLSLLHKILNHYNNKRK